MNFHPNTLSLIKQIIDISNSILKEETFQNWIERIELSINKSNNLIQKEAEYLYSTSCIDPPKK